VIVAEKRLGAARHPVHGAAELARCNQDREVLRIRSGFQSERAAYVLGGHAQALVGYAENRGKPVAQGARALRTAAQEIALGAGIVASSRASRLHRIDHQALVRDAHARHVLGRGDDALDLLGVPFGIRRETGPIHGDVAGRLGPDLRRAGAHRLAQVDDRRAFRVIDRDQFGGVLRRGGRLGNDDRDRLAHVSHGLRQRRTMRNDELGAAAAVKRRMLRYVADPLHVVGGEHREHARRCARGRRVDRAHIGEGARRAHEIRVGLPRQRRIGGKPSEAAHQRIVLETRCLRCAACYGRGFHVGFRMQGGNLRDARL